MGHYTPDSTVVRKNLCDLNYEVVNPLMWSAKCTKCFHFVRWGTNSALSRSKPGKCRNTWAVWEASDVHYFWRDQRCIHLVTTWQLLCTCQVSFSTTSHYEKVLVILTILGSAPLHSCCVYAHKIQGILRIWMRVKLLLFVQLASLLTLWTRK